MLDTDKEGTEHGKMDGISPLAVKIFDNIPDPALLCTPTQTPADATGMEVAISWGEDTGRNARAVTVLAWPLAVCNDSPLLDADAVAN